MPDVSPPPHAATPAELTRAAGVDPARGLSAGDATARLSAHGPNRLQEADAVSAGGILLAQPGDPATTPGTIQPGTIALSFGGGR